MDGISSVLVARRGFVIGGLASSALLLSGCAGTGASSMVEAIQRLLTISSQRAFARLTAPGGFWDSEIARFDLPELFTGGSAIRSLLTSTLFRTQLQRQLNIMAEKGAERAAPVVYDAVRSTSIGDAVGIVRGGPTAATTFLRSRMGPALINAMIPGLADVLRVGADPVLGQAIRALSGVDLGSVAQAVAIRADNSIWYQIGAEETAIRANPQTTGDPLLIGLFKVL